jgi:hypothetical protein
MRTTLFAVALLCASTSAGMAQTADPNGSTPAVTTPEAKNATALVEGSNSFTEEQAKQRAVDAGYSDVSALTLDDKGIWRGTAKKSNASVTIGIDYQGNVVSQ